MRKLQSILFATGFGVASRQAATLAVRLAHRSWQEHEAEVSLAYLERLAGGIRSPSVEVRTRVVDGAHVASAIPEADRPQ